MPPQKNSGNKKGKRETEVSVKNKQFVNDLISDIRNNEDISDIHIGVVTRQLGYNRVEVFYVAKEKEIQVDEEGNDVEKIVYNSYEKQALIKGSFRGKGKRSVWIGKDSAVVVAYDRDVDILTIMAVLSREQLNEIKKYTHIDERVFNRITDNPEGNSGGIEFKEDSDSDLSDKDISKI